MSKMKEQREEIIAKIKKIALKNYENGGDVFIECYDSRDWDEYFDQCNQYKIDPIKRALEIMGMRDEHRKGVEMWMDKGPWD